MNAIENLIFENSHKCQEKYIYPSAGVICLLSES
jgi:hypothetical protein